MGNVDSPSPVRPDLFWRGMDTPRRRDAWIQVRDDVVNYIWGKDRQRAVYRQYGKESSLIGEVSAITNARRMTETEVRKVYQTITDAVQADENKSFFIGAGITAVSAILGVIIARFGPMPSELVQQFAQTVPGIKPITEAMGFDWAGMTITVPAVVDRNPLGEFLSRTAVGASITGVGVAAGFTFYKIREHLRNQPLRQ